MAVLEDSRFNSTVIVRVENRQGEPVENDRVDLPYPRPNSVTATRADAHSYPLRQGDTWPNLAARFYRGRSDLWWVLAEASGVIDPFTELRQGVEEGRPIVVLPFDVVMFDILNFDE